MGCGTAARRSANQTGEAGLPLPAEAMPQMPMRAMHFQKLVEHTFDTTGSNQVRSGVVTLTLPHSQRS